MAYLIKPTYYIKHNSVGIDEIPLNSNVTIENLDGTHTTGILKDKTGILTTTIASAMSNTQFEGKDGVTTIEGMTDSNIATKNINDVLTWDGTNWVSVASAGGTGLEKITEGVNTGWRLVGSNPANYGNIGKNAIDLSYSNSASTTLGATGNYSTAIGNGTTASGPYTASSGIGCVASSDYANASGIYSTASGTYATARGNSCTASGTYSLAKGKNVTASGSYSTATGYHTTATGAYSLAMGFYASASGDNSVAIGYHTTASAVNTVAMGLYATASVANSTAIGKHNVGTATTSILEVGIGTSTSAKANGLEVHSTGTVLAPGLTIASIKADVTGKMLVTKEYVVPKGGTTANRPVDPELYTVYWDTDINAAAGGSITCVNNTTGANVWKNSSGVVV